MFAVARSAMFAVAARLADREQRSFVVLPLVAAFVAIQAGGAVTVQHGCVDRRERIPATERLHRAPRRRTRRSSPGDEGGDGAGVSEPTDPVLMWTSFPWPYLNYDRVPATRYIWKNFLLGEIYLAESGPAVRLAGHVGDVRRRRRSHRPDHVRRGGGEPGGCRHTVRGAGRPAGSRLRSRRVDHARSAQRSGRLVVRRPRSMRDRPTWARDLDDGGERPSPAVTGRMRSYRRCRSFHGPR